MLLCMPTCMVYGESSMCGYTLVQAISWTGEQVCYQTVVTVFVVVVIIIIIIIIILKCTYYNIAMCKFLFDKLYTTETFM
jgi:uncharacterized membrane protein YdbT with pleckstrin-like domain